MILNERDQLEKRTAVVGLLDYFVRRIGEIEMKLHESHIKAARKLVSDAKALGITHLNVTRVFKSPSMHHGIPDGAGLYRVDNEKSALNTLSYMYRAIEDVEVIFSLTPAERARYIQRNGLAA